MSNQKKKKLSNNQLPQSEINHVISLYSNGQVHEAIEYIAALDENYPNVPLLFNILGACYKALGQLDAAEKMFKTAFTIKPDYAEAHFNYAVILKGIGNTEGAIESYQNAIKLLPSYPNAYNNLGSIYKEMGLLDQAIENFEWAVSYNPEFVEALNNLGIVHRLSNNPKLAIESIEKALSIKPNYSESLFNLAIVYKDIGNKSKSLALLDKVIELIPNHVHAYRNISLMKTFSMDDPLIEKMESIYARSDIRLSDSIGICFALSKVYEDLGSQKKQFKFLNEGNKKRKKELNYSFEQSKNLHLKIKKIFSINSLPVTGDSSVFELNFTPIFIVGLPRSGTSLVEQILASHNQVYGAGELGTLAEILSPIINDMDNKTSISSDDIQSIRENYFSKISSLQINKFFFTDKMPSNFRYIGFIRMAFPEAKIIHLKRDARATCWSMYKYYFDSKGLGFSYDQEDLVDYYKLYTELMNFWHNLFPNAIYDICYEDLTVNQESEIRKLINYCELGWDDNCLNFHKNKRAVKTTSAMQVRNKIYQGSSDVWKKYETHLKTLVKGLEKY
jgi:tetratricopeptide (TPR) repeat protein